MKQTLTSFLIFTLLFLFGCSGSYYTEIDRSQKTRTRTLPEFHTLNISGNFEVTIDANSTQRVEIIADDDVLPYVVTKVNNKELKVSTSKDLGKNTTVKLKISMEELRKINSSGVSEIVVNNLNSKEFELNISGATDVVTKGSTGKYVLNVSGAADLVANGKADNFIINVSGASDVNAKNLESKNVDVNISGAAEVVVNAVSELEVYISGVGEVKYTGSPKISKDVSGFGSVKKTE